jgi:thiol-disulfide isomerase/thioredoxin
MLDMNRGSMKAGWSRLSLMHVYGLFDQEVSGSTVQDSEQSIEAQVMLLALDYAFGAGVEGRLVVPAGMITHETADSTESLSGFGDIDFQLQYRLSELWSGTSWTPRLTFGVGLRLPTGAAGRSGSSVTEARIADATGESIVPPTLLALGSGAFGVTGHVTLNQPLHPRVILNVPFRLRAPLSYNNTGVRFGVGFDYSLGISVLLGGGVSWTVNAAGRYLARAREREKGEILQSGGQWFAAETGFGWAATDRLSIGMRVRVPFYQQLNGTQLTERMSVFSIVSWRFGREESESVSVVPDYLESPPGVDDLAKGGASFAAKDAPLIGKVTIIDFWGDWCSTCKAKLPELIAFQKKHANDLALRRVEVPDFDTPVALEHMPEVGGLPHIWIYDRAGVRQHVLTGGKQAARLKELVRKLMAD